MEDAQALLDALSTYQQQLQELDAMLQADPENAELQELRTQLQEAVAVTAEALQAAADAGGDLAEGVGTAGADAGAGAAASADASEQCEQEHGAAAAAAADAASGVALQGERAPAWQAAEAAAGPRRGAPNNARMHPANKYYRQEPDFAELARAYPQLQQYITTGEDGRARYDYQSWEGTRELTAALLHADLRIAWSVPQGQLVAPLVNRSNYVHWLNDLLQLSCPQGPVRGLDVGCGANFIYCLLGAALYGWRMVGLDVTQVAVRNALALISSNPHLAHLLEVRDLSALHPELQQEEAEAGGSGRKRRRPADAEGGETEDLAAAAEGQAAAAAAAAASEGDLQQQQQQKAVAEAGGEQQQQQQGQRRRELQPVLLPAFDGTGGVGSGNESFTFTMCNPPFFASLKEAGQNPNTAFGGTAAEMVCRGGEAAFVGQMLRDSEQLAQRVHWFSTMVGKKATLKELRKELHARHVTALRTTEFAQGRTSRWAVAWSWQVDPNKAAQPLRAAAAAAPPPLPPRAEPHAWGAQAQAASAREEAAAAAPRAAARGGAASSRPEAPPVVAQRQASFTVTQADGAKLLQRLAELLREAGAEGVETDPAQWSLRWPMGQGAGPAAGLQARLRVCQQQRGRFEVMASLPNSAPQPVAMAFTRLMADVKARL